MVRESEPGSSSSSPTDLHAFTERGEQRSQRGWNLRDGAAAGGCCADMRLFLSTWHGETLCQSWASARAAGETALGSGSGAKHSRGAAQCFRASSGRCLCEKSSQPCPPCTPLSEQQLQAAGLHKRNTTLHSPRWEPALPEDLNSICFIEVSFFFP